MGSERTEATFGDLALRSIALTCFVIFLQNQVSHV
jgi:hypothetical protein